MGPIQWVFEVLAARDSSRPNLRIKRTGTFTEAVCSTTKKNTNWNKRVLALPLTSHDKREG
jgi:hypothetical protein